MCEINPYFFIKNMVFLISLLVFLGRVSFDPVMSMPVTIFCFFFISNFVFFVLSVNQKLSMISAIYLIIDFDIFFPEKTISSAYRV